jgi:hypothetical protein
MPRMGRRLAVLALALCPALALCLAVALALAGCSSYGSSGASSAATPSEDSPLGDIPDDQVFVPYTVPDGAFTVEVPEGWARTDAGGTVGFTDKLNTVTVQELTGRPQPTPDSVRAGELADVAAHGSNVTLGTVEQVTLPAGPAMHATYQADAEPDPVTGRTVRDDVELYVYWKDGTEVLVTLSGPQGADNVDPWKRISTSFTWSR